MNRRIGRKRQKKKKKKKRIEIKKWVVIVLAEFGGFCLRKKKKCSETDFVGSIGEECSSSRLRGGCC